MFRVGLFGESAYDLVRYGLDSIGARDCKSIRKGRSMEEDVLVGDLMPHREEKVTAIGGFACREPVELSLRPLLGEECLAQDDEAEARIGDAEVDLPPQAVTPPEGEFVVPHGETPFPESIGQWPNEGLLVLARVTDKEMTAQVNLAMYVRSSK